MRSSMASSVRLLLRLLRLLPLLLPLLAPAPTAVACSGVVLVGDGAVVAGGNEDNTLENASIWAIAATESAYGAAYFGFYFSGLANRLAGWYEMQGVNDQGLFYDLFSIPCVPWRSEDSSGPFWGGRGFPLPEAVERTLMTTCSTVEEALTFLHGRNYAAILPCVQVLLADREGNAAVYTGDGDVIRTGPGLVVTNYHLLHPELGGYPCERYNAAARLVAHGLDATLDNLGKALRIARYIPEPGEDGGPRYAVACDLVNGIADVYVGGDFSARARLDLLPLWRDGLSRRPLSDLEFSPSGL